jgi:hypothetical protein
MAHAQKSGMLDSGSFWHTVVLCIAFSIGCGSKLIDQPDAAGAAGVDDTSPTDALSDAGPSTASDAEAGCALTWVYASPGCGAAARPVCEKIYDASMYCNSVYCTCDGQTVRGVCETPQFAWSADRACDEPDAALAAPEDGPADVQADAECPDGDRLTGWLYSAPGCGAQARPLCMRAGFGYGRYFVGCSCEGQPIEIWPAVMYATGQFASAPFASLTPCEDSGSPTPADAGARTCAPPYVWKYDTVGCGAEARPVCGPPVTPACYQPACSCRGETIGMCGYANEPIALFGMTCEEAGARDAGAD